MLALGLPDPEDKLRSSTAPVARSRNNQGVYLFVIAPKETRARDAVDSFLCIVVNVCRRPPPALDDFNGHPIAVRIRGARTLSAQLPSYNRSRRWHPKISP